MGNIIPIVMLIFAYLFGSIPFGVIVGKFKGIDIREHGSHNIGATNASRTLGPIFGLIVFILDFIKGGFFVLVSKILIQSNSELFTLNLHPLYYGLAAFLGHLYPIFIKFKGGKGISTVAGILAVYNLPMFLLAVAFFFTFVIITKYVSVASTSCALSLYISFIVFRINDLNLFIFCIIVTILVVIKHIPNYKRLINHTENKMYLINNKKKSE